MANYSGGISYFVGDGASTEVFIELALLEAPELFSAEKALIANRTTADTGNTKKYSLGYEDGETLALMVKQDYDDAGQNRLRAVKESASGAFTFRVVLTDGTATETYQAEFLMTSAPITPTDPNGDGEEVKQAFNIKRNSDWVDPNA